jgi:tetratricopeptide (TPR) repeat protein
MKEVMNMNKNLKKALSLLFGALFLSASGLAPASAVPDKAEEKSAQSKAVQTEVDQASADKAAGQRDKIVEEAVTALAETEKALKALNDGKTDEALKALEKATGKLELILARDPGLALVPVSVDMVTYDLYADVDTVKAVIKEAGEALDEGRVQQARRLMSSLASEVVINTTNIPLATYPDAIKAISPLLDKGETEKAKAALQAALNTLVVTTDVVPLPLLRSQYMLARAEKLAEKKERSEEDDKALNDLLQAADQELKLAEVLGYGSRQDFKPLHEQIGIIREKATGGNSGKGWFDELKKRLSDLF